MLARRLARRVAPFVGRVVAHADDEPMKVIVGLGNPGKEYERTRHNVGWWVVDHLADVWHFDGWRRTARRASRAGIVGSAKVRLVKPQTYMNLSGAVLAPYLRRAVLVARRRICMVVVDEVALPRRDAIAFAREGQRRRPQWAQEHRGDTCKSQDYPRLRIGIAPERSGAAIGDLADYVLGDFGKHERRGGRELMPPLTDALELWSRTASGR